MKLSTKLNILSLLVSFTLSNSTAQDLNQQITDYVNSVYQTNGTGATILIAKNGAPIYKQAFGNANLELDVPMKSENVFEIGSITKQFTAVAILMLEEQGKLSLEDPITKFIPDYPTRGKTITIHHLLNHTSGIKSYTSMNLEGIARTDMSPSELIDYFKNEPMDFDPGDAYAYNNSGYILLGHIIEVITNESYENFIEKNIFEKLEMHSSYYGSMTQLIKNRASGYQVNESGYVNAEYLSLTLPYAAGSIMSTTEDLLKWQNALSANKLISAASYKKATSASTLNNGETISYGLGWDTNNINGSRAIEHGGGIFGYTTHAIFFPEENVYAVGLSNCNCENIQEVVTKIAAMAIDKPFPDKKDAITLTNEQLKKWVGAYAFDSGNIRYITLSNGKLNSQREGSSKFDLYPLSDSHFIFEEGTIGYKFSIDKNGKRIATMNTGGNISEGIEIDKAAPTEKQAIKLSEELLQNYVGTYELQPEFKIVVTKNGSQLFAKPTGQSEVELFAEKEDHFFLKVVPADIEFTKNENGIVNGLILNQGGQKMPAKKIE